MTNPLLSLARELGERLGGADAGYKPIERPKPATPPNRIGRAGVWPPEVLAEIRAIYAGEIE